MVGIKKNIWLDNSFEPAIPPDQRDVRHLTNQFHLEIDRCLHICVAVIQVCRMYRLSAESMVEEWVAFCSTKKLDKKRVTIDMLDHLDREVPSLYYISC